MWSLHSQISCIIVHLGSLLVLQERAPNRHHLITYSIQYVAAFEHMGLTPPSGRSLAAQSMQISTVVSEDIAELAVYKARWPCTAQQYEIPHSTQINSVEQQAEVRWGLLMGWCLSVRQWPAGKSLG